MIELLKDVGAWLMVIGAFLMLAGLIALVLGIAIEGP